MSGKSMRWADGFIAVDWGTTNRRAYLIDSDGKQAGWPARQDAGAERRKAEQQATEDIYDP